MGVRLRIGPTLASRTWATTTAERTSRPAARKAWSAWAGSAPRRTSDAPPSYQPMPQPCGWRWDWKRSAFSAVQSGSALS